MSPKLPALLFAAFLACGGTSAFAQEVAQVDLPTALTLAATHGPLVLEANARAEAADAAVLAAGQLPSTVVALGGGQTDPIWSAEVRQPFFAFGVRSARIEAAQHAAAAAHALAEQALHDARAEARRAFVELLAAQDRRALAERTLKLAQTATTVARERFTAGSGPEVDVVQAKLRESLAEAELQSDSAEVAARSAELALTIGREPSMSVIALPRTTDFRPTIEEVFAALSHSPAAKAQQEEVKGAQAAVDEQRSARLPALALAAGAEAGNGGQGAGFRGGLELEFPLLGFNRGLLSQASAQLAAAELVRSLDERARLTKAIATHRRLLGALDSVEKYRTDVLPAADRVEQMALDSYRAGKSPLTALIEAQRSSAETRARAIDARLQAENAAADLYAVLGVDLDAR